MFWAVLGAMTLYYCLEEGLRRGLPRLKDRLNEARRIPCFICRVVRTGAVQSHSGSVSGDPAFHHGCSIICCSCLPGDQYVQIPKPGITNGILVTGDPAGLDEFSGAGGGL